MIRPSLLIRGLRSNLKTSRKINNIEKIIDKHTLPYLHVHYIYCHIHTCKATLMRMCRSLNMIILRQFGMIEKYIHDRWKLNFLSLQEIRIYQSKENKHTNFFIHISQGNTLFDVPKRGGIKRQIWPSRASLVYEKIMGLDDNT